MSTIHPIEELSLHAMALRQPPRAREEAGPMPDPDAAPVGPEHSGPRGNGPVHDADLTRGREQLDRVLGW